MVPPRLYDCSVSSRKDGHSLFEFEYALTTHSHDFTSVVMEPKIAKDDATINSEQSALANNE